MFVGKIVETPSIWYLLQCNLLNKDWKTQNKKEFGYLCSRSKLQHCFLLRIQKVHVRKQSGTQLLLP